MMYLSIIHPCIFHIIFMNSNIYNTYNPKSFVIMELQNKHHFFGSNLYILYYLNRQLSFLYIFYKQKVFATKFLHKSFTFYQICISICFINKQDKRDHHILCNLKLHLNCFENKVYTQIYHQLNMLR